jgi:hypothetical protein
MPETPGRLTVGGQEHDDWGLIRGGDGKPLATTQMLCRETREILDNAERVVACWNACQGIATDDLEADVVLNVSLDRAVLVNGCRGVLASLEKRISEMKAEDLKEEAAFLRELADEIRLTLNHAKEKPNA